MRASLEMGLEVTAEVRGDGAWAWASVMEVVRGGYYGIHAEG